MPHAANTARQSASHYHTNIYSPATQYYIAIYYTVYMLYILYTLYIIQRQPLPYKYILSGVSGHSIQFLARTLSYLASITLGQSHQLQRTPTHT